MAEGDVTTEVALVRLEAKIDRLGVILDERLESFRAAIESGDRASMQAVTIIDGNVKRIEKAQEDQERQLRVLERTPDRLDVAERRADATERRVAEVENRIGILERDRAKLIGFLLGAAAAGGGIGAAIAQMFAN